MLDPQEGFNFKNVKIKVATPAHDGRCHATYLLSYDRLRAECEKRSIDIDVRFEVGNSLLFRARNDLAKNFMESDSTHILMVDSDITFYYEDIFKLISLDKDVIGSSVSKKYINWGNIKNYIQRKPDMDEKLIPYFGAAQANFVPYEDKTGKKYIIGAGEPAPSSLKINEPIRASSVGTAIMLIKRCVFEKMEKIHPELKYRTYGDGKKGEHFSYFEMTRTKENFLMSEDVSFCQRVNNMGMEVWAWPWGETVHSGSHDFPANMSKWVL